MAFRNTRRRIIASLLACAAIALAPHPRANAAETLRIGVQKTGTFAWQIDVIRRHNLARDASLELSITDYASPDAGKLAINAGSVDIAVVDWLWVARERALGAKFKFYPYSSAVGAVMVRDASALKDIADLKGKTIAIAGGPLDKSWLILRAVALQKSLDLKRDATLQFGAPPLIYQKALQSESDASLHFWNFAARLETQGFRRLFDIREAQKQLGLKEPIAMIGYAFSEDLATKRRGALDRFLAAAAKANDILARDDAEWEALRPLMKAEDAATFAAYRDRTREGMPRRAIEAEEADARVLFKTLLDIGGAELVGPAKDLDAGLYYRPARGE